jgi:predicted ester cyclase
MKKIFLLCVAAAFLASCGDMGNMSSKKEADNKANVQRFYDEVINAHNPAMVDSFCAADFTDHDPGPGSSGKGLDELKKEMGMWFSMMPDVKITTDFMVAKGDTVIAKVTFSGNTMTMPGMPAASKPYSATGIDIIVIKGDKATDRWGAFDMMGAMSDAGMMGGGEMPADTAATGEKKM